MTSIICNRKEKNIQQSAKPIQNSINLKKEANKKPQQNQSVGVFYKFKITKFKFLIWINFNSQIGCQAYYI